MMRNLVGGCLVAAVLTAACVTPSMAADPLEQLRQDTHDNLADRRAALRRLGDPRYFDLHNVVVQSNDILAATHLQGCGPAAWRELMVSVPKLNLDQGHSELFALPALVRYLYQFGSCLEPAQKKQVLANLSIPQALIGHGTTNQAIVQASSWYLLAQYFPDHQWRDIYNQRSYSSAQLMAILKAQMLQRTRGIFHFGHDEWLSPNYALLDVYPLLNLIDFAADADLAANAGDEATLEVAMLRANSFHGELVPPLTRKTVDQRNAEDAPRSYAPSVTQQMVWYYFGEPSGLGLYDFRSGLGAFFVSMLGISEWLPPDPVLGLDASAQVSEVKTVTPQFTYWGAHDQPWIYGDSVIGPDFSIGTGNQIIDPQGIGDHTQTFSILLRSDKPHNEIECYQPYWRSARGEDAWSDDRSSPFQQMYRYDTSSVVMLFDIPAQDPWKSDSANRIWKERAEHAGALLQLVTCRFARDFDETVEEPDWIFVREGHTFVAMATLHGKNDYDQSSPTLLRHYRVIKIRQARTALFFRVERERADMNFAQFRQTVRRAVPQYDPDQSMASLTEAGGVHTLVHFALSQMAGTTQWRSLPKVQRDGVETRYDTDCPVRSPALTLCAGTLSVQSPLGVLTLVH